MRNLARLATAGLLATLPLSAQAQNQPQNATQPAAAGQAPPQMTPEQLENLQRGVRIMRAFTAAFTSDDVSDSVKGRLITCLYGNTLAQISTATGRVFANSPNLDAQSPTDLYRAAAGVCGVVFRRVAPEDGAATPAPSAPRGTQNNENSR